MKKILLLLAVVLLPALATAAPPSTLGFRNVSTVAGPNYAATCTVMAGTQQVNGAFDVATLTNYAMTKGGVASSIATSNAKDYKVSCFQTASPKDAITVKMFINGSETNFFPMSSLLISHQQ